MASHHRTSALKRPPSVPPATFAPPTVEPDKPIISMEPGKLTPTIYYEGVSIAVEEVTPRIAQDWLENHNPVNRNQRRRKSDQYARDMDADHWLFNADPIRFDVNGDMLDGQHRAIAIVKSGKPQPILVIRGLPRESQKIMDTGIPRTFGDALGLDGEVNAPLLGAVIRRLRLYAEGMSPEARSWEPTRREMLDYLEAHPMARRGTEVASAARNAGFTVPHSAIGAAFVLCAERDWEAAEEFFARKVIGAIGLAEDEPAMTLRNKFTGSRIDTVKLDGHDVAMYSIIAWNHWRRGTKVLTKLQKPKGGWKPMSELKVL